jgi:Ni/Fe-hydrogenase subunit HybB-like protein
MAVTDMAIEASAPLSGTGYAAVPITKAPDWHDLVAWDLLLNNLATGLFLAEALGELTAPAVFRPLAALAYPIALTFLLADLLCLVLDLGDPLRFHHMLRVFKPTSPMSLGTWCLTVYSFPLTVVAALSVLPVEGDVFEWTRKILVVLAILPALGSAAYKGVLLSTNAQPGWRDARWLGGYLTNSALMLGCAVLLAMSVMRGQDKAIGILRATLALLIILNVIFLMLLIVDLRPALVRIFAPRQLWYRGLLTLGGGMLAPLGFVLAGRGSATLLPAVLLLVLGCLAIRFVIIKIPHALRPESHSQNA